MRCRLANPGKYHYFSLSDVDNGIFTNSVFVHALQTTLDAAARLGLSVPARQLASWRHAAQRLKLKLEVFGGRLLHKEYDQYTFSSRINDTKNPNHSHDASQPKFLSHPSIGQGDSVLLGFPLQFNASHRVWGGQKDAVRLNDISYYGPRVSPSGSYMTAGHYVIAWLERPHRDLANASAWFAKGRAKNYAPWRIWAEHDQNDGGAVNFITGKMAMLSLFVSLSGSLTPKASPRQRVGCSYSRSCLGTAAFASPTPGSAWTRCSRQA
eukprot:COSAG04_NODE_1433_length_6791_cov_2.044082_6_plen_267_part_00